MNLNFDIVVHYLVNIHSVPTITYICDISLDPFRHNLMPSTYGYAKEHILHFSTIVLKQGNIFCIVMIIMCMHQ